jgi:hypothetical protein
MSEVPDGLVLRRHRDLEGFARSAIWWRRAIIALLTLFVLVALANVFGQRPSTQTGTAPAASLSVYAPTQLRSGLLFSARFRIEAHDDIKKATLVFDPGWLESIGVNTIEPSPVEEASRNGHLALDFGHVAAGSKFVLYMQFQVNATNVGRRSQSIELDDGTTPIVRLHRTVTIYP